VNDKKAKESKITMIFIFITVIVGSYRPTNNFNFREKRNGQESD
jgi:hypothetical protein